MRTTAGTCITLLALLVLVAVPLPARAEGSAGSVLTPALTVDRALPVRCLASQGPQPKKRRWPWGLGWLQRYGRDVERGAVAATSFYLRSPLLSGLYRRPGDCPPDKVAVPECGVVSVVGDDDAAIAIEVALPQLQARSPRELRDVIRERIASGESVVLTTTDGTPFDLIAGTVREIEARACVLD